MEDDSKSARQQISPLLKSYGYEVVEAVDGEGGVLKVEANPNVAMILGDPKMPKMDGIWTVQVIIAGGAGNFLPVVPLFPDAGSVDFAALKAGWAGIWLWDR